MRRLPIMWTPFMDCSELPATPSYRGRGRERERERENCEGKGTRALGDRTHTRALMSSSSSLIVVLHTSAADRCPPPHCGDHATVSFDRESLTSYLIRRHSRCCCGKHDHICTFVCVRVCVCVCVRVCVCVYANQKVRRSHQGD